jgi:DNA-binding CsgD family transcriptional regulator
LTPAEARVASIIAEKVLPERAAEQLGVACATVRVRLKVVFAKTGTRRQAEFVALFARV